MYTTTPTLTAAAQAKWAKHAIAATVRDTAHRWTAFYYDGETTTPTAMAGGVTAIVRAKRDGTDLIRQRITDPTNIAQWQSWAVADTVDATSDIAVAHLGADTIHTLGVVTSGGTWQIYNRPSDDGGATWYGWTGTGIAGAAPAVPHIAASGAYIAVTVGANIAIYHYPTGGPRTLITTALTITTCYGIALLERDGVLTLAVAYDGVLEVAQYTIATSTWSAWTRLAPGADAPAAPGSQPSRPALAATDAHLYLAYITQYTIPPYTWAYSNVYRCAHANWPHFGEEIPLETDALGPPTLTTFGTNAYAAFELLAMRHSTAAPAELALDTPHYYHRQADADGADLTIHVSNRSNRAGTGAYARPGDTARPEAILYPISQLLISRGYITTTNTAETIDLPPYYITAVHIQDPDTGDIIIDAEDALHLLNRWRPPTARQYLNRSLNYIAKDIAGQIGVMLATPNSSPYTDPIPSITWPHGMSAGAMLRQILALVGAKPRVKQDGSIYATMLNGYAPAPYHIGNKTETHAAAYGARIPPQTSPHVFGFATARADYTPSPTPRALGITLHATREDWRIATQPMADELAGALWAEGLDVRHHTVTIPLRPECELYDRIYLTSRDAYIQASYRIHRIMAIKEELTLAMPGVQYETTLTLAG